MDQRLEKLISDYHAKVSEAVAMLEAATDASRRRVEFFLAIRSPPGQVIVASDVSGT